ncbi:MAG: hypothetical protein JJLCMIEE_01973 [Acidimicrobiales bacterium]|nr:MAG: hypothetical protein EDR02_15810 [Actinomycetota bacterium]MBV6508906.1 hypothetical protein [Acidimicrobiales bacterium]RIK03931.1 MAG: hypothetical protein DCC48_14590 [Acidobacteriota bacterium]
MVLAELDIFHSRPVAPTRRVALGEYRLPTRPAPGFGGILLGAVVARFILDIDRDFQPEFHRLTVELEEGRRIVQPRLRHRFQSDRVGLLRSRHRLVRDGERVRFALDDSRATPLQHLLGAVYAAGSMVDGAAEAMAAVRAGMLWRGPLDDRLVAHLSGRPAATRVSARAMADPVSWALDVLDLRSSSRDPGQVRLDVQRRFRDRLRDAHPDHGGETETAAQRIADLREARRILLAPAR